MSKNFFTLKRKERFNNQVILDLAYLLIDHSHLHVAHVELENHEANLILNSKIGEVLDSEYTLDYLNEKQLRIRCLRLAENHTDKWVKIKRSGKLVTNQRSLLKMMKPVVKAYFRG